MSISGIEFLFRGALNTLIMAGFWASLSGPVMAFRPDEDAGPLNPAAGPEATVKNNPAREHVLAAKRLDINVTWHERSGTPISVKGRNLSADRNKGTKSGLQACSAAMIRAEADAVLNRLGPVYGIREAQEEFSDRQIIDDQFNYCHVRRPQIHEGRRVIGGELIIHFDQHGRAYEVNGRYIPNIQSTLKSRYQAHEAAELALIDFEENAASQGRITGSPEPVVFAYECEPRPAYETLVSGRENSVRWRYWIDAETGAVLLKINDLKTIAAPTANGTHAALSGNILNGEGGSSVSITGWQENTGYYYLYNTNRRWYVYNNASSGYADNSTYAWRASNAWSTSDRSEISAARNFDLIQQYYRNVHNRSSFNNAGIMARANVHQGSQYVNAYWDGADFHFGDGNGSTANSLAVLDVCAHEFTHAVTEYTADLYYYGESGALNESFSDIFGACVEFYAQADGRALYPSITAGASDWLMGEDCWLSSTALRDMRAPRNSATVGSGVQPSRYHGTYWYSGGGDNGGVHYNSGVHNFLFYLVSEGGSGDNDGISYNVGGIGVTNAAQVAYRALTVYCGQYTDYSEARSAWLSAAADLNPAWVTSVSQAWDAVGVESVPEITSAALGAALNASELSWKTWGSTGSYWFAQSAATYDGNQAAQSGPLGNSQQSYISTTVTGPGTLSFYWRVSSEEDWDYLYFYVDGSAQNYISGESGWQSISAAVAGGMHTCRWSYIKDTSIASGSDAGWVDQVVWSTAGNQAPSAPALISPANGATSVSLQPALTASAFSDQDGDPQANSQWQVDNNADFSSPVWDSGESYSAGAQATVPDNKLTNSGAYYWRARYKDNQNTWSGWAFAFSFTTLGPTVNAPAAPAGLTAADGQSEDNILVYWNASPTAAGYKLWRATDNNAQNAALLATLSGLTYLDSAIIPGLVYYYWVQAANSGGTGALSAPDSGYAASISSALGLPSGLQAGDGMHTNKIQLTWQGVNNSTQYEVWRNTTNVIAAAALIARTLATNYNDSSVAQGILYYYWVRALNAAAYGSFSAAESGWSRLGPPDGLSASDGAYPYRIVAAWNSVENTSGYEIWRLEIPSGSAPAGANTLLAMTTATSFDDYTAAPGTVYRYGVKAYNTLGASDFSTDTGWRQMPAPAAAAAAMIDFDGDRLADPAVYNSESASFHVLCSSLGGLEFNLGTGDGEGLAGHLDSDRATDPIVYNANSGTWLGMLSTIGYGITVQTNFIRIGIAGAADFDGDRRADLGIYNDQNAVLSVLFSNQGAYDQIASLPIAAAGYEPVFYDFDGDRLADPTFYSESAGMVIAMFSGNGYYPRAVPLGGTGKKMSAGDFDGDSKADPVFYEETTGIWNAKLSSADYADSFIAFGGIGYVPLIDDYDGDGYADFAVYQESNGTWLITFSSRGYAFIAETFGGPNFKPVK